MYKSGVYTRQGLQHPTNLLGRRRKVAIPLVLRLLHGEDSRALGQELFSELRMSGTYKKTADARFKDFDGKIAAAIAAVFPGQLVRVHDLAASSGVTSLELLQRLRQAGIRARVTASDYFTHVYALTPRGSGWTLVLDADLNLLQAVGYGFVLGEPESAYDPVNRMLLQALRRGMYPRAREQLKNAGLDPADFRPHRGAHGGLTIERTPLLDPEVLRVMDGQSPDEQSPDEQSPDGQSPDGQLSDGQDGFRFLRHDIFSPLPETCQVIRAMNILNPGYFDDVRLRTALDSIDASLEPGGLLIVGRTGDEGGEPRATIFRKDPGGYTVLEEHAGGSEVAHLVPGRGARP